MPKHQAARNVQWTHVLGRFWTVANVLSLIRLVLVIPITYLIIEDASLGLLFGLIILAIVSDWFDGRVARWSHTVSEWGKVLDPVADKVAAAMIVLALTIRGSLPVWFLVVIVVRDLLIVLGGMILVRRTGRVVMSMWTGKIAVGVLALTVLAALLKADQPVLQYCMWATTVLLVVAFLLYGARFVRLMRQEAPADEQEQEKDSRTNVEEGASRADKI